MNKGKVSLDLYFDHLKIAKFHQFQGQGIVQLETPRQHPVKLQGGQDGSLS